MTDIFEFIVDGAPVSNQARRRERVRTWIARVAEVAKREWPVDAPPWREAAAVAITHYIDRVAMDLDNLPKPILDATKGIVMVDDSQVVEMVLRKRRAAVARGADDPDSSVAGALATWPECVHSRLAKVREIGGG